MTNVANDFAKDQNDDTLINVAGECGGSIVLQNDRSVSPSSATPVLSPIGRLDHQTHLVIGIDPGWASLGLSVRFKGRYLWSTTLQPDISIEAMVPILRQSPHKPNRAHIFCEWNVFSKGKIAISRMGCASGLILMYYATAGFSFVVHEVVPTEWKAALGLPLKDADLKREAMKRCAQMGIKVGSHDEAEANLISDFGYHQVLRQSLVNQALSK